MGGRSGMGGGGVGSCRVCVVRQEGSWVAVMVKGGDRLGGRVRSGVSTELVLKLCEGKLAPMMFG